MDIKEYLGNRRQMVDDYLQRVLPDDESVGAVLAAMRYSLFVGGKRLRPILCMAGAEAVGADPAKVLFCCAALEMVHTYSLVHDDLPAMDDDDMRRGRPTNHKVFGEGMAVLAGDGLLTEAAVLLTDPQRTTEVEPRRMLQACQAVMRAAGYLGMVGGQAADLQGEQYETSDLATVEYIHTKKTGALITASVEAGGILGGGSPDQVSALVRYGRRIGLAFQIADDLLDLEGDPSVMGKAAGMDAARSKVTYPSVLGVAEAKERG